MADRSLYSNTTEPPPDGDEFLAQYADRVGQLFNASVLPLTGVGGTGNAVTATLDPPLLAGLVAGMKVTITWAATNSGGMTLAINGGAAVPVLQADGSAMPGGAAAAGARVLLEYVGAAWRVIGGGSAGASAAPYYLAITASTTWTKPSGYADDALVMIEAWGAGASGERQTSVTDAKGGVGGEYSVRVMRYIDVPSSLSVVIGAGGAAVASGTGSNPGGATTVGAILAAAGGGTSTAPAAGQLVTPTGTQMSLHSGAHGGEAALKAGYAAVFGGAGGGAYRGGGGVSKYGGNGGAGGDNPNQPGGAGQAPGGAGGASYGSSGVSGAGARGEVRIRIIG